LACEGDGERFDEVDYYHASKITVLEVVLLLLRDVHAIY